MSWFTIALLAPFFWSISNHVDKYLLSRFLKSSSVGALVIFSSMIGLLVLPIMYVMNPNVLNISLFNASILIFGGMVSAMAILLYLYAMNESEASIVVPFFQLIPVFLYIFGYILLGETLEMSKIFAGILIILGALILSVELEEDQNYHIKKKLVLLMVSSSILYALYETVFKFVAIKEDFWVSNFWQYTGLLLSGIIILIFGNKYRKEFIRMTKDNGIKIFGLNIFNEVIIIIGNLIFVFASLMAPIALVGLVNSYQPIFVFIGGVLLTLLFPKIATEKIQKKHMIQKIAAISIIFIGSCFL